MVTTTDEGEEHGYWSTADLCPECLDHYFAQPHLVGACASVGIELGGSTGWMLKKYFEVFHKGKHREA